AERVAALVAAVLEAPLKAEDYTAELGALGIDSLMAIELIEKLNAEFAVGLPVTMSLFDKSVVSVSDRVIEAAATQRVADSAGRTCPVRKHGPVEKRLRLVCAHYLGGDADVFEKWDDDLGQHVDVCPIALPRDEAGAHPDPLHPFAQRIAADLASLPP